MRFDRCRRQRRSALLGLLVVLGTIPSVTRVPAQTPEREARAIQVHYQDLRSLKASFRQTYEANSIRQEETGTVWLLKPGRMRWEYRHPELKIFLSDGKATYFYVASANQVSVRKLSDQDLDYTPFGFLIGRGDLMHDFHLAQLAVAADAPEGLRALSLIPRRPLENVTSMELEYSSPSMKIVALTIHEFSGGTSRFDFSELEENTRLPDELFRFKAPKGAEIVHLQEP